MILLAGACLSIKMMVSWLVLQQACPLLHLFLPFHLKSFSFFSSAVSFLQTFFHALKYVPLFSPFWQTGWVLVSLFLFFVVYLRVTRQTHGFFDFLCSRGVEEVSSLS